MCQNQNASNSNSKRETSVEKKKRRNKPCKIFLGIMRRIWQQIVILIKQFLEFIKNLIFSFFMEDARKPIPNLEARDQLLTESAVSLAAKIRKGELKSEALVKMVIDRINVVNPLLNAVTDTRYELALNEAREVDKLIEAGGLDDEYFKKKPFLGVPFTAKESHAVDGLLHTLGVQSRAHLKAQEDAECVRLVKQAGAIAIAVTNVPEINKWQETRNTVFGQTNNPYHLGRTTGGSSGGEAALHAALASPISLCSDIGGSTRMPAFYCGLFALNPTPGYTSLKGSTLRTGLDPSIASIGFVSKHVEDLAPLTKIVAGEKAHSLSLDKRVPVKDIRFFYTEKSHDWRVSLMSKDLRDAMKKVVTRLSEEAGSTDKQPKKYYHEGFNYMFALWKHAMTKETDSFPKLLTNNQGEANGLVELVKKIFGQSEFTFAAILKLLDEQVMPAVNPQWGDEMIAKLQDDLGSTLGEDGVLLFPSAPMVAPYHYSLYVRPFNFSYWAVFNAIQFPAAQVPLSLNNDGIPVGIQVVAAPRQEGLCLSVAEYLSKEFGGYVPPYSKSKYAIFKVPLGLNNDGIPVGIQVVAAPRQEGLCLSVAEYLSKEFGGYVPPCKIMEK